MGNDAHSLTMMWGMLVTLLALIVAGVWAITDDYPSPTERRALRYGIVVGIVSATLVVFGEAALYYSINRTMGIFMFFPSMALALLALGFAGRTAYISLGGGQVVEQTHSTLVEIENETLEKQGNIWCRLRDLPHFRETLGGALINMATGDCVYWTELKDKKCIEIKLAGVTVITGTRFETLTKYLAIQTAMAQTLGLMDAPEPQGQPVT